tara:strand:- start:55 stop:255 length:201 start_codon:yes stop_codon:yes gene_type:complete
MDTQEIIKALQLLNEFCNPNESTITHYKGTDDMGNYEYSEYKEDSGLGFSSPNLHYFIECVTRRFK